MKGARRSNLLLKTFVFIAAFALAGAPTAPLATVVPTVNGEAHAYFYVFGFFGYSGGNCTGDSEYSTDRARIWNYSSHRLHTTDGFGSCSN